MTSLITQKDQIIAQMRAELSTTIEEDRYYTEENITDCNAHLEAFLAQLEKADEAPDKQTYLAEAIQTLCERLSTFNDPEEEEMPEYLWGFLYNGYTIELSNFIRDAALAYGFEIPAPTVIALHNCSVEIDDFDCFSVVLGGEEEEKFACLEYDPKTHQYFYDENPYGDTYPLPLYNVQVNADYSELSFEVLSKWKIERFQFLAQYPSDKVWIKAIYDLHTKQALLNRREKHWSTITLGTEKGKIIELRTTQYDNEGHIIPSAEEGGGFSVFTMGINNENKLQSRNEIADTKILFEKTFFRDAREEEWRLYELQNITIQNGIVTITSTDEVITRDQNWELIRGNIAPVSLSYELKNSDFVLNFIQKVIETINELSSFWFYKLKRNKHETEIAQIDS